VRLQSRPMTPERELWGVSVAGAGLFGLVIGSFLNVVIYRLPRGMSVVRPPSHCPSCGTRLGALENVPLVSWLALRARCRHCGAPISPRYPLVELATGLAFCGLAWSLGPVASLPSLLLVAAAAVAATGISVDGLSVPYPVPAAGGLGAASLVAVAVAAGQPTRIGWAAVGGVLAAAAALVADGSVPGRNGALVAAGLGFSASWLWPPGGWVLAGWLAAVALGGGWWHHRRPAGNAAACAVPVLAVALAALGLLLAGAALSGPT